MFGSYDTAAHGGWTLTEWKLTDAQHRAHLVEIAGRHGSLDLSTVQTDGVPVYDDRTLTAVFESSEGDRLARRAAIKTMKNWLDGWTMEIHLPDDPLHYIKGRVHVEELYNDPAHASVRVTAVCEPWFYSRTETVTTLTATETEQAAELVNTGRLTVVPLVVITTVNSTDTVHLSFGSSSWALGAGTYKLPDLVLQQGTHELLYSGAGTATISYREAVL